MSVVVEVAFDLATATVVALAFEVAEVTRTEVVEGSAEETTSKGFETVDKVEDSVLDAATRLDVAASTLTARVVAGEVPRT